MVKLSRALAHMMSQRFYTRDHKWIALNRFSGTVTVGVTKSFQKQFGEVIYVSTPPNISQKILQNDLIATLEAVKSISDIHSPVSGDLLAVNSNSKNNPEIINQDAENEGWLFKLKIGNPLELKDLLNKQAYEQYIKETNLL